MKIMVAFLGKKKTHIKAQEISDRILNTKNLSRPTHSKHRKIKEEVGLASSTRSRTRQTTSLFSLNSRSSEKKLPNRDPLAYLGHAFHDRKQKINDTLCGFKLTSTMWALLLMIPVFVFAITHLPLDSRVYQLATNFRQASDKKIQISDILSLYGFFNTSNYVINPTPPEEKVITASNENQNEIEIIDSLVQVEEAKEVFSRKTADVMITDETKTLQRINMDTFKILNYSSNRKIDFAGIMAADITLTKGSDKILLYNTHTSESYTNSEKYKFEYEGIMRSRDATYNMIGIAKALSENLKEKGIQVTQDTTPHDYGTYTSAYARSRITIKNAISTMGGAGLIVDVHRDASADLGFRPVTTIKGVQVAQLMFVMGVGSDTTKNPHYQENLKMALKIQQLADKIYPGLFRPMIIRDSVYNQDMNKYAVLVEFGATGNTIEEVKLATRCLSNLLNIVYKD